STDLVIITEHGQAKHSRNRRDTVIRQSDHQALHSIPHEGPDKRWTNAVSNLAGHLVDGSRKLVVVTQNVSRGLAVPTPKGQVVDPHIGCVANDLLVVSDPVFVDAKFLRIAGRETHLTDGSGPGWTIAQRLDLRVL